MKPMKMFLALWLWAPCALLWAQTNQPAKIKPEQQLEIDSDKGYFDGITNQMVYIDHVFVTDHVKSRMNCERLTVDVPRDGGHPTNIVAETHVKIDFVDSKGVTNHITADKAVYAYSVRFAVTNETVTFTGDNPLPEVENPQMTVSGEPLVYNVALDLFTATHPHTIFKKRPGAGNDTNASPFNLLK
jgi:lipopolysaccharide export system protein LptA